MRFTENSKLGILLSFAALIFALNALILHSHSSSVSVAQRRAQEFGSAQNAAVPEQFSDRNFFLSAIKQNKVPALSQQINGITVPHHLLAKDIIAGIFSRASANKYQRIIIFSPDHFYLGKTEISYATQDFNTVFGPLSLDQEFTSKLAKVANASAADFFYREHGIGAELPFIKYFFPDAKIVVMDLSINAKPDDLQGLVDFLKANIGPETLLIQSTDFSHYLTPSQANKKDQQTINLLDQIEQGADPSILFQLNQPDNIDCIACQYLQSRIQREVFGAHVHIIEHKNSQDYSEQPVRQTTSYIPQIYFK